MVQGLGFRIELQAPRSEQRPPRLLGVLNPVRCGGSCSRLQAIGLPRNMLEMAFSEPFRSSYDTCTSTVRKKTGWPFRVWGLGFRGIGFLSVFYVFF